MTLSFGLTCTALAEGAYLPGTYSAKAQGFGGEVEVSVEVGENSIEAVAITGNDETPEVGGAAIPELEKQVMDGQSADVEGVSGATFTSTAVKEAVAEALSQAAGEEAAPAQASLAPGTYTATKDGFQRCHVTVSVTVDEEAITDVVIDEITDHPQTLIETPCRQIPEDIVSYQTYNVDGVTGATLTSNGVAAMVKDGLTAYKEFLGGATASEPVEVEEAECIICEEDVKQ